jgi:hypothetical protein
VIEPRKEVNISIRSARVSDPGSSERDALAGDWSASFLDADRKIVKSSEPFRIPAAGGRG